MEELIKRLERVIQTGAPDKDGMHPISAETVLEVVNELSEHGTNLAEVGTDCISRQAAIDALCNDYCGGHQDCKYYPNCENLRSVQKLPSAQPEIIRCAECKWFQCNMRQDGYLPKGVDEFECRHWCGYCDPTDFCSYAERRTNG